MKRIFLVMLAALAMLVLAAPTSAQPAEGIFTPTECPFEIPANADTPIDCGFLTVPQNRADPASGTIDLAVAILGSRSATPAPDPIIYLEGGPGGSALVGVEGWYDLPLLDTREMILFDQRGTGYSQPSLDCPGIEESEDLDTDLPACRADLVAQGVDLDAYTSAESAADVNALREALGYDQVNLLGISYGTRLGLTVMRDYPDSVRAAILDSVYPPDVDTNYVAVPELWGMLNALFADCAADAACNAAFPDLQNRFFAAVDGLIAEGADPETGEPFEFDELYVYGQVYQQFFNGQAFSAPAAFDALINGDYDTYLQLAVIGAEPGLPGGGEGGAVDYFVEADLFLAELPDEPFFEIDDLVFAGDRDGLVALLENEYGYFPEDSGPMADIIFEILMGELELDMGGEMAEADPNNDGDSYGMNLSVQCAEELPFMDVDTGVNEALAFGVSEDFIEATYAYSEFADCQVWNVAPAPAFENDPVVSETPTLLFSGEYDPATPPSWGDLAAASLPNSTHIVFPRQGHSLITTIGPCGGEIAVAFLDNPTVPPPTTCADVFDQPFFIP
ncbi:MAG: alpha/beta hydrolase [Anaerolineales bacterium]